MHGPNWLFEGLIRKRSVALLAVILVVGIAFAASGASAQEPADAGEIQIKTLADEFGISQSEARQRIERQPAISELQSQARARYGKSFAGLWVDHRDGGRIHIAFSERAPESVAALAAGFGEPALLVPETAERSLLDLESLLDEVLSHRSVIDEPYDALIDVIRNSVVISTISSTGEAAQYLQSPDRFATEPVEFAVGIAEPTACLSRTDCDPDIRSGLQITSTKTCTTAFSAVNGSERWGQLSAAHCLTGTWWHQGNMGFTDSLQQSGKVDGQFIRFLSGYNPTNYFFISGGTPDWTVTAVESYSSAFVGESVCSSGRTTGYSCGNVGSVNYAPWWVPSSSHFITAKYCSEGGDSGAGVMTWHTAVGINSGGWPDRDCNEPNGPVTAVYGHIEHAAAALGVTVRTY